MDNFRKITRKCSQDAADADFTVRCDSAPPHPVRCPKLSSHHSKDKHDCFPYKQHLSYTVTVTTNCHTTGPRVSKHVFTTYPNTWKIMFFRLIIHNNNRNKSINFIFIWNHKIKQRKNLKNQTRVGMINQTFYGALFSVFKC